MNADLVMDNIRKAFESSGMTLKAPRISTVLAVTEALGVKMGDLVK